MESRSLPGRMYIVHRVRGAVLCLSQDEANLFENLSENSWKGDLSNDTTENPPLFSLVNTFNLDLASIYGSALSNCWIHWSLLYTVQYLYFRQQTIEQCSQACRADPQCQSWTWYIGGISPNDCYVNYETPLWVIFKLHFFFHPQ
jgi:hypothetical protein